MVRVVGSSEPLYNFAAAIKLTSASFLIDIGIIFSPSADLQSIQFSKSEMFCHSSFVVMFQFSIYTNVVDFYIMSAQESTLNSLRL